MENHFEFNAPLYNALCNYLNNNTRFHMPGHVGGFFFKTRQNLQISDCFFNESKKQENEKMGANFDGFFECAKTLYGSAPFDLTELDFSDNLNNPTGAILEAEKLMAKAYGAKNTLFFTGGATSAIFASLFALRQKTDKIAIDALSHKSIFAACRQFGFEVFTIKREFDNEGFPLPLSVSDVEDVIKKHSVGAVSLTSPDYFGNSSDIENIYNAVKKQNAYLMVDEAHGSHYAFSEKFLPSSRFSDITVNSLHKTLPVFTGGAVLRVNCDLLSYSALYRAETHTSSPNYVIMASMDFARAYLEKCGAALYKNLSKAIADNIEKNKNYSFLFQNEDFHDCSRLVINADETQLKQFGIYPEMTFGRWCVFIVTPFNADKLNKLSAVLSKCTPLELDKFSEMNFEVPEKLPRLSPNMKTQFIPLEQSEGYISASDVGCYPPGIPIVFCGEKITKEKLAFLLSHKNSLFNIVSNNICVIINELSSKDEYGEMW